MKVFSHPAARRQLRLLRRLRGNGNRDSLGAGHELRALPDHHQESPLEGARRRHVEASYEKKQAVVTLDDAKTSIEALTRATANAGYPSTPKP